MSWSDFYLLCFLVGFSLSVISFLAGAVHLHLPFKMHFPFHGGHVGHGGAHIGHGGAAGKGGVHLSWLNASTIMAFLAWFGGAGYILTRNSKIVGISVLLIALMAGLTGGWIVFRFMARLMRSGEGELHDWDYRHEGCLGTVTISIPAGGTGEIVYVQKGVRKSAGARSEDGSAIAKGAEIVINRYEKGIAYVRRWDEFMGEKV